MTDCPAWTGDPEEVAFDLASVGAVIAKPDPAIEGGAGRLISANDVPSGFEFMTRNVKAKVFGSGPSGIVLPDIRQPAPVLSVHLTWTAGVATMPSRG